MNEWIHIWPWSRVTFFYYKTWYQKIGLNKTSSFIFRYCYGFRKYLCVLFIHLSGFYSFMSSLLTRHFPQSNWCQFWDDEPNDFLFLEKYLHIIQVFLFLNKTNFLMYYTYTKELHLNSSPLSKNATHLMEFQKSVNI